MPIHDWSHVDANLFHHFHQTWTITLCDDLNRGLLPRGYSALVERHSATLPRTSLVRRALAARANRVVIRHRLGEVVCVLEIVSPGNKSGRAALRAFVEKTVEFLRQGVNLLVIDLLPPTPRDPQGMHKTVWDEVEEEPYEPPPGKPLTLAAYVAGDLFTGVETTAYVEPVGVGDALPDMPAYLDRTVHVPVPLEATYQAAWATCPADMRELVETGKLTGEGA
jgi:hypothetical protein